MRKMSLNSVHEHRFRDDKKFSGKENFSQEKLGKGSFRDDFSAGYGDLFTGLMGSTPLAAHNFSALHTPLSKTDGDLFSGQGASALAHTPIMQDEMAEGFSPRYLSDAMVKQLMSNPAATNMSFSIEHGFGKLGVEANIVGGCLRCEITPSNENLRRKLKRSKEDIERSMGRSMRMFAQISICSDEL